MKIWSILIYICGIACSYSRVASNVLMKCSYGERGSQTVNCVNATPNFFKSTPYKFRYADEIIRCLNCTLTTIESNTFDINGNQIKVLDLSNSSIETLKQKAFVGLIYLDYLNLSKNKIKSIDAGTFSGIKKITTANLTRNEISIISEDGFAELTNLQKLVLKENQIKSIDPKAFSGLANLKELDLSFNFIEAIGSSLINITTLEIVSLRHNNIKHLSGNEFFNLRNLNEIDFSENSLTDGFSINMLPGNQLRKINLANNKIESLWFQTSNLNSLEIVDLQFNNVSIIHNEYEIMYNLHTLNLAYNNLSEIRSGQFSGLSQLRTLNLSHNVIKEVLTNGVFLLQNLHTLDLSHNKLEDIDYPALISKIPGLSYLRLEDNDLPCDLESEMEQHFAEDNFKYVLYDNAGSRKCVDKPHIRKTFRTLLDIHIFYIIFVLIAIVFIAIGVLFYFQYLFHKRIQLISSQRKTSTFQLIPSNYDSKEDK